MLCSKLKHSIEPIESELAKQVEYDMDEQGRRAVFSLQLGFTDVLQTKNG